MIIIIKTATKAMITFSSMIFFMSFFIIVYTQLTGYESEEEQRTGSTNLITTYECLSYHPLKFSVEPFSITKIIIQIDEAGIPLIYGQDYSVKIVSLDGAVITTSNTLDDATYNSKLNNPYFKYLSYRIFNFNQTTSQFTFQIIGLKATYTNDIGYILRNNTYISTYSPNRASYQEKKVFPIIITSSLYQSIQLPTNLYIVSNDSIFVDVLSNDPQLYSNWDYIAQYEPFYDTSYWNDQSTILLPWLPFFSHCTGMDRRIILYDLLELQDNCSYVEPENIYVINNIPFNGLNTIADSCSTQMTCQYIESHSTKTQYTYWYQISTTTVAFYLGKDPISIGDFIQYRADSIDSEAASYLNSLLERQIEVNFVPESGTKVSDDIPQDVELNILYYQQNPYQKSIVKAEIKMKNYTTEKIDSYRLTINFTPLDYIGLLNNFKLDSIIYFTIYIIMAILTISLAWIFWKINKEFIIGRCLKKKQKGLNLTPTLKFIQTFKLCFIHQFLGSNFANFSTIYIFIIALYFISNNRLLDSISFNHDNESLSSDQINLIRSGRLGLVCLVMSWFFMYNGAILLIPVPSHEDEKLINQNLKKKYSELKVEYKSTTSLNSVSTEKTPENSSSNQSKSNESISMEKELIENEEDSSDYSNKSKKEPSQKPAESNESGSSDDNDSSDSSDSLLNSDQEGFVKLNVASDLKRKRHLYILICFGYALIWFLFVRNAPRLETFNTQVKYQLAYELCDIIMIVFLKNFWLKEALLLAPLLMTSEIIQIILMTRANNFEDFVKTFIIKVALLLLYKAYLEPILKNIEYYINYIIYKIKHNPKLTWFNTRIQLKYLEDPSKINLEKLSYYIKNNEYIEFSHNNNHTTNQEYAIFTLLNFCTKSCTRFLMIPIFIIFQIFPSEISVLNLLTLENHEFPYYFGFWLVMILPFYIVDIYILNTIEIIHGLKLFDYLSFMSFKYQNRDTKWLLKSFNMDKTVQKCFRSLHSLGFCSQFFFIAASASWGILVLIVGLLIIYANSYSVLADPAFFMVIFTVMPIYMILKFLISKIRTYWDIWKVPDKQNKVPLEKIEKYLTEAYNAMKMENLIRTDLVRLHFLDKKKIWLIKNLKHVVNANNFYDNDGYLLKLYQQLVDNALKEQNEKKRLEFIAEKKNEQFWNLPHDPANTLVKSPDNRTPPVNANFDWPASSLLNLKTTLPLNPSQSLANSTQMGDAKPEGSSKNNVAEGENDYSDTVIKIKKSKMKNIAHILIYWLNFSKQNIYLKELVSAYEKSKEEERCIKCGLETDLRTIPQVPMVDLVSKYRINYSGLPFNKYTWIKFYEKNQKFMTLCPDCEVIEQMKNINMNRRKQINPSTLKSGQTLGLTLADNNGKNNPQKMKKNAKVILMMWYMNAKSNLLHKEGLRD